MLMDKISKMVYEAPFIEVVPMEQNLMDNVLSYWDDGHGGRHELGEDDSEGMGKEFGFEQYEGFGLDFYSHDE